MLLALAWLTVSTPFVYAAQQQQKEISRYSTNNTAEDFNPFAGTTEEKTSSGINTLSEEYLHEPHHIEHHFSTIATYYKCHPTDLYFAFHPELLSPPPEA